MLFEPISFRPLTRTRILSGSPTGFSSAKCFVANAGGLSSCWQGLRSATAITVTIGRVAISNSILAGTAGGFMAPNAALCHLHAGRQQLFYIGGASIIGVRTTLLLSLRFASRSSVQLCFSNISPTLIPDLPRYSSIIDFQTGTSRDLFPGDLRQTRRLRSSC